jgi:4-hydroxy-tetrahydrodipicolinate synthase
VILMVGVDTEVYHGFVKCGAVGAITGIGTIFPKESLLQVALSRRAAEGCPEADLRARELAEAFSVLAKFDEGVDLVLYFKHLMVLKGESEYALNINETDALSPSQAKFCEAQFHQFNKWFAAWSRQGGVIAECM